MKRPIAYLLGTVLVSGLALGMVTGCGGNNIPLAYHYYESQADDYGNVTEEDYNHGTVYQNDLKVKGADPSAIYVTEGEEKGYYYMYNTSDPIGATGYLAYRSKNLNDWECMGVAYNPTMYVEGDVTYSAFSTSNYWAPEVIYDEDLGLYLMFYNAAYLFRGLSFYIDVAVSEDPQGPFIQYAKWKYDNGTAEEKAQWAPVTDDEAAKKAFGNFNNPDASNPSDYQGKLKVFMPLLDFSKVPADAEIDPSWQLGEPLLKKGDLMLDSGHATQRVAQDEMGEGGYMKVIDASPFIDENGEKYLYFVQDLGENHSRSSIGVIKMNDDWTPDYTQMKKLTYPNQTKLGGAAADLNEGNVNEAPFMVKHGSKYYLMYSANSYTQVAYSVRVAVGDSPMGPFKKLALEEGGWLLYSGGMWASGTGHHSFVNANGSTYVVYHAHTDRRLGGGERAIAFDEIVWTANEQGLEVPHANGPTFSHMPLTTAEWKNIAKDAAISCSAAGEGSDVKYLNDGIIKIHDDVSYIHEFGLTMSETTITLEFEDYREISALFIANSYSYDLSVAEIAKVEFDFKDGETTGTAYTEKLEYDYNKYYPGEEYYVSGGTFAIEFKPMLVKTIRITLPKVNYERALSEIMVLGK